MRTSLRILTGGLLVLCTGVFASPGRGQSPRSSDGTSGSQRQPAASGYSGAAPDFHVGRTVYLRSTKTRIGTIEQVDDAHSFPPRFSHSPARAVLIHRKDGPYEWIPLRNAVRIYVVGAPGRG